MRRLLEGIATKRFLVVGRVGMDFSPDPPGTKTERAERFVSAMGGSAANTAAGIVKLGGVADLVTCVSDDAVGRYCLDQLDAYGVGRSHVRTVGGEARTSLAVYESRLADHQTVIYRNGAADFEMNMADVEVVDYAAFGAMVTAGTVFAAEPSRTAAFRAMELARKAGLPVIFDIDYRPYSWPSPAIAADILSRAGAGADTIVGNDEEFGFMAGAIDKGLDKARALARAGVAMIVYKMGPQGAITLAEEREIRTGIYRVDALKPTGAGDSFMAGLLASLADGHAIEDSVMRGSACAAIVVSRPGCAPAMPYPDELEAFLAAHPGPSDVERKTHAHSAL